MKILIPLDGSALALSALSVAEAFARERQGELLLLAVGDVAETSTDEASLREALTHLLDEAATRVQDVPVRTRVEIADDAARTIERVAGDEAIDLIVMTTHGRSGLSPLAHGRVADAMLRRSRTPVTLVRPSIEGVKPESQQADPGAATPAAQPEPARASPARIRLSLLGALKLSDRGEPVALSAGTQRLLAFVALGRAPISRDLVAEALWPTVHHGQSQASLRSALWRLEQLARAALSIGVRELDLSPEVELDLEDAQALAQRMLDVDTLPSGGDLTLAAIAVLSSDLLPDWHEDWTVSHAQDWHQLRLHALEALAQKLHDAGRYSDALETASEAKKAEPLRESPRALIIRIHQTEGNQSEVVREYLSFSELLQEALGIKPTQQLQDLVGGSSP